MEDRKDVFVEAYEKVLQNLPADPALPIPLLRDFAGQSAGEGGLVGERLNRRYLRLCAVQEGLGRLDFKKAGKTASFDDFVFSQTDFGRYGKIPEERFTLYTEGLEDFEDSFYTNNFRMGKEETGKTLIQAFKETGGYYCLVKPSPVILAMARTLETSTEALPLLCPEEILGEMKALYEYLDAGPFPAGSIGGFFNYLLTLLDNRTVTHSDGMETRLFIDEKENLSGTFKPGGKPWTVVLVSPLLSQPPES
jgi:hypothetical protein